MSDTLLLLFALGTEKKISRHFLLRRADLETVIQIPFHIWDLASHQRTICGTDWHGRNLERTLAGETLLYIYPTEYSIYLTSYYIQLCRPIVIFGLLMTQAIICLDYATSVYKCGCYKNILTYGRLLRWSKEQF